MDGSAGALTSSLMMAYRRGRQNQQTSIVGIQKNYHDTKVLLSHRREATVFRSQTALQGAPHLKHNLALTKTKCFHIMIFAYFLVGVRCSHS